MKFLKLVIILSVIIAFNAIGQVQVRELKIGDKITDVTINHILNYKSTTAKISDFKGKLLILDFWATWCVPCIRELPRMDSLQQKFGNQIMILPVCDQEQSIIKKCLANTPSLKHLQLPTVIQDTILSLLFPHVTVPHEVIIDSKGIVKAITESEYIDAENIGKLLKGDNVSMNIKITDPKFEYYKAPLFMDSAGSSIVLFHRLLTRRYSGNAISKTTVAGHTATHGDTSLKGINMGLLNMYRIALRGHLGGTEQIADNRLKLLVKDSSRFYAPHGSSSKQKDEWEENNAYCYDYTVPAASRINVFKLFKEDLDLMLHIKSKVDTEIMDCYILKSIDSSLFAAKGPYLKADMARSLWTFRRESLYNVVSDINVKAPFLIVDETGYHGKVDLVVSPAVFRDERALNETLKKNGLELVKGKRKMEIITIEDAL